MKKAIFKLATGTKSVLINTLLSTYIAVKNQYYLEEIENGVTMEHLFEK